MKRKSSHSDLRWGGVDVRSLTLTFPFASTLSTESFLRESNEFPNNEICSLIWLPNTSLACFLLWSFVIVFSTSGTKCASRSSIAYKHLIMSRIEKVYHQRENTEWMDFRFHQSPLKEILVLRLITSIHSFCQSVKIEINGILVRREKGWLVSYSHRR